MWIYWPVLMAPGDWAWVYIGWWVRLLGTVGPG
jgi:hypothetical protein